MFIYACPEMHSQFLSHHQYGFSMGFLKQEQVYLFIVGSSNGLVLCTASKMLTDMYYVCNPLTKKWVLLPPPLIQHIWVATGFICNDECVSSSSRISTSYKVIRIPINMEASKFKVEIFSSDLGKWNVYDVSYPLDATWGYSFNEKLVTHNGVCYRFQKEKRNLLAFSISRNNNDGACGNDCRSIDLPDRAKDEEHWDDLKQYLGESEGLICYAIVNESERSLSVWVLEEDWYLMHKDIEFDNTIAEMESSFNGGAGADDIFSQIQVLGFNPVDKNVVILSYKKCIWSYNFRTRGYEQLSHVPPLGSKISMSHMSETFSSKPTFALKPTPTTLPPVTW
ncbi:putative F-box protein At3g23950 [Papaver somniferum]|uniref:putative F-box protein At3g23950 n=1 Tax=Papaver somniferum TaxID=3469 RepID=UPI000E7026FA|nr:putative F-box protein At3g23950 [Papaver somniferum]